MAIARSSRLTNTLWSGLNVWLPFGTMPTRVGLRVRAEPQEHHVGAAATNRPSTDTSLAVSLAVRRNRNRAGRARSPTPRRDDADREHQRDVHRPVMRDVRVVVDRGHEERDRPERQVEDARRAVREHQTDRQQRVDAAEAQTEDDRAEEHTHASLVGLGSLGHSGSVQPPAAWYRSAVPVRTFMYTGVLVSVGAFGPPLEADPRLARRGRDGHELAVVHPHGRRAVVRVRRTAGLSCRRARAGRCAGTSS